MPTIALGYGHSTVNFEYDAERFAILTAGEGPAHPLSDVEIGEAFDAPIGSPPLDDLIEPGDTVLIVVSDATRATGSAQIVNLLVRRLIQNGIEPGAMAIIFATGIHRPVRPKEKVALLTPFIAQRIRTVDHDSDDASQLVTIGEIDGTPVKVNRALQEFSKVIVTGAVGFHYFAGFTGGRKSICPGLAGSETIAATHMLALDLKQGGRRRGVAPGLLDGNAVNEECERIAAMIDPAFAINAIVDDHGRTEMVFAGHWRTAHRLACENYLAAHALPIPKKREFVIVTAGGSPHDINLIQAHKALDMAAQACVEGGTIILLAECADGLGRPDFLKWFESADSSELEARLRTGYEVNGQTAWALLTKAERWGVYLVSNLANEDVRRMRMIPAGSLVEVLADIPPGTQGYIMPFGAALLPVVQ